ncbi:MAG: hypothetical protein QMB98_00685 [Flaviflexus sp.]|uniref:hypothetical protein n=1 Tax=Flaviflexus sp. TaxID=1969482 RepID=UPI00352CB4A2
MGATDPTNPLNQNAYREVIKSVLPDSLTSTMVWSHLRGGIDFPKLKPVHRILMQLIKPRTRRAAAGGDAEAQSAYEPYGKVVDFRDRNSIRPIVSYIESMHR